MKIRVSPDRIVNAVRENFKGILSKPGLKNLILVTIAISLADKLKINEMARHLPVDVKHQKGHIILIGIRCQHRAQSHGTYKFLLNALLYPEID